MGEIFSKLQDRARENLVPFDVMFEMTYGCNQRCVHCYNKSHYIVGEMNRLQAAHVLEKLAAAGSFMLTLTGGEALTRKDFFEIAADARRLGFCLSLISNGTLIDEKTADRLAEAGFVEVGITIFSLKPEIHESITRLPGSSEKALRGIDLLLERGQKVSLRTVIMKQNENECEDLIQYAEARGMRYLVDPTLSPRNDGDDAPQEHQLEESRLAPFYADERINFSLSGFPREGCPLPDCDAGRSLCSVDPYGNLYPCLQLPIKLGNLLEEPFEKLWHESDAIKEWRKVRMEDLEECRECELGSYCLRCSGIAYLEGHGVLGRSDMACKVARVISGLVKAKG